jgi:hypothetical protein
VQLYIHTATKLITNRGGWNRSSPIPKMSWMKDAIGWLEFLSFYYHVVTHCASKKRCYTTLLFKNLAWLSIFFFVRFLFSTCFFLFVFSACDRQVDVTRWCVPTGSFYIRLVRVTWLHEWVTVTIVTGMFLFQGSRRGRKEKKIRWIVQSFHLLRARYNMHYMKAKSCLSLFSLEFKRTSIQ